MFDSLFRRKNKVQEAIQLERLSSALLDLGKKIPLFQEKAELRTRLLKTIAKQQALPSALSRFRQLSCPSDRIRKQLRERVIAPALPSPVFLRRAWAFATVFVFAFVMIFSFTYELPTTFAKRQTYIEPLEGEVFLYRDALREEKVLERAIIREGDIVATGENGKAAVYFFDDTVSRLAPNSRLRIDTMFMDRFNSAETLIAVSLEQGKVWTNVVNLPSSMLKPVAHFGVRAQNVVIGTQHKATFTISADRDIEVTAVNQPVTVQIAESDTAVRKTVVSPGYALRVAPKMQRVSKQQSPPSDQWVEENIALDVSYEKQVLTQYRKERDRILSEFSGNPIAPLQEVSEKAKLFITKDPIEHGTKLLAFATRDLLEAEQAFERDERAEGERFLASYQETMKELFAGDLPQEVSQQISQHILQHRKALALIPPDSALYNVKEALRGIERLSADSPTEQRRIELAQASDRLSELKALADFAPSQVLAVSYLKDYEAKTKQLLEEIALLDDATKAEFLPFLFDRTAQDLALLQDFDSITADTPQLSEAVASAEKTASEVVDVASAVPFGQSPTPLLLDRSEIIAAPGVSDSVPLPQLQLFLSGEPEQEAQ